MLMNKIYLCSYLKVFSKKRRSGPQRVVVPLGHGIETDEADDHIGAHEKRSSGLGTTRLHAKEEGRPQNPVAGNEEVGQAGAEDGVVAEQRVADEVHQEGHNGIAAQLDLIQPLIEAKNDGCRQQTFHGSNSEAHLARVRIDIGVKM